MLRIDDFVDRTPRTLAYGYTASRDNWHAYMDDPDPVTGEATRLHVVVYSNAGTHQPPIWHQSGEALEVANLRPGKRVYPHTADFEFAALMARRGEGLPFTTYSESAADYGRTWWAPTLPEFP